MAETVRALVDRGIPVIGHLGLTPQSVHALGGYRVQGRDACRGRPAARRRDARWRRRAPARSCSSCVPTALAARVSKALTIPTIGIGAGAGCDGQVLVLHDMLGLNEGFTPKFLKRYARAGRGGPRRRSGPTPPRCATAAIPAPSTASTDRAAARRPPMIELETIPDLRRWVRGARAAGRRIALVPTMGYLHEGHLRPGGRGPPPGRRGRDEHLRQPAPVRAQRGPRPLPARPAARPRPRRRPAAWMPCSCPPRTPCTRPGRRSA